MASILKIEIDAEGEKYPLILEFEIDRALYETFKGLRVTHCRFLVAEEGTLSGLIIPTGNDKFLKKWS